MAPPKHRPHNNSSERVPKLGTPAALGRLTQREQEVMEWIAKGKRNDEIAMFLKRSPRTIEKHVENVLRKLGVANRTSACAWLLEQRRDAELSGPANSR